MKVVGLFVLFCCICIVKGDIRCGIVDRMYVKPLETPEVRMIYPTLPATIGSCGGNCTYFKGFSCLSEKPSGDNVTFVDCTLKTPTCLGRFAAKNSCETMDCCRKLNQNMYQYVDQQYISYNYYMEFRDEFGQLLHCDEFSSYKGDSCVQFADYGSFSDELSCKALNLFFNNADSMSFELF